MDLMPTDPSNIDQAERIVHPPSQGIQGQMDNPSRMDGEAKESTKTSLLDHELGDECNNDPRGAHVSDSRVQYFVSELDANGRRFERVQKARERPITQNTQETSDFAFVVKEIRDDSGKDKKIEIILKGQELRNIMQDVLGKHLEHDRRSDWAAKERTLEIPFSSEIRCLNELSEATQSRRGSEQGRKDLQLLLEHLQYLRPDIVKLMGSIQEVSKVLPSDLWFLFRPGDLVISKPYFDEPQLFRISECHLITPEPQMHKTFEVVAWAFDWTGIKLAPHYYSFRYTINKEGGDRDEKIDIIDLPCYPIRYYKNNEGHSGYEVRKALFDRLIERGQKFRNLCRESVSGKQYTYNGELLYVPQSSREKGNSLRRLLVGDEENPRKLSVDDDIMIDFEAYKTYGPSAGAAVGQLSPRLVVPCKCKLCFDETTNSKQWMQDFGKKGAEDDTDEEKDNYLLLPARALGYCLHRKIWAQFHVTGVEDIATPSSDTFSKKLVFPESLETVKNDLKTLIEQHGKPIEHYVGDPIAKKGCGLVVLLHGPPGVGKTLTAECLAKSSGKPLYLSGASDIGLEPTQVEEKLDQIFQLAERWRAILLIDEADVFLDSRGSKGEGDVNKNALVSVMLRVLEYFKGIIIMTTNRIMTFDVAMLSRCHYAIDFKSLTLDQERKIWKGYLDQLNDQNSQKKAEIEDWVKQITKRRTKLSGREIRNVFTTAQTLAQGEHNSKIKRDHLERVYERLTDFAEAMEKTKANEQLRLTAPPT